MRNIFSRSDSSGVEPTPSVLESDLDRLFAAVSPVRMFDPIAAAHVAVPAVPRRVRIAPRFVLGAAAVALAAVVAIAAWPNFASDGPRAVSAAEVIEKARQAATLDTSYVREHRLTMTEQDGSVSEQIFVVWYRDETHWKTQNFQVDPAIGDRGRPLMGTARDGDAVWVFNQDGEILRVGNFDITSENGKNITSPDWSLRATLDEGLALYGPGECSESADIVGTETVGARTAYRIEFAMNRTRCPGQISSTVWIDTETFVALKQESTGVRMGTATELLSLEIRDLSDDEVIFVPPSGTWVNYQDRGEVIQVP